MPNVYISFLCVCCAAVVVVIFFSFFLFLSFFFSLFSRFSFEWVFEWRLLLLKEVLKREHKNIREHESPRNEMKVIHKSKIDFKVDFPSKSKSNREKNEKKKKRTDTHTHVKIVSAIMRIKKPCTLPYLIDVSSYIRCYEFHAMLWLICGGAHTGWY